MSPYLRKSTTGSGATQVRIAEKRNGRRRIVEHIGSAHDEAELAVLANLANERLHGAQPDMLPLEPAERAQGPVVEQSSATVLWSVLTGVYRRLSRQREERAINAQVTKAEKVAAWKRPDRPGPGPPTPMGRRPR